MNPTRIAPQELTKVFDQNVATVDERLNVFLKSGDASATASLRKATRRLRTTYSVLPKRLRRDSRVRRYVSASRELSKAAGDVRDIDTVAAWATQVSEGKDQRSFISDLERTRATRLRAAIVKAKELKKAKTPSLRVRGLDDLAGGRRASKVERRLSRRVDREFEEFMSTQEVDVMHALRKDSKRLRHLLELLERGEPPPLLGRLRSIQDDLGAIRDHDLVIEYLRRRVRLTSTRSLVREEMAKRHARLEDFLTENRGQGHLVPFQARAVAAHSGDEP